MNPNVNDMDELPMMDDNEVVVGSNQTQALAKVEPAPEPPMVVPEPDPIAADHLTTDPKQNRAVEVSEALMPAYAKAGMLQLQPEESNLLMSPFPDDVVEVRPHDGLIYIPHIMISNRLTDVFGPGQWVMIRRQQWMEGNVLAAEWVMVARGCLIGDNVGMQVYHPNNPKQNWGDVLEATRGECIRRIAGKQLRCGDQVWNPTYAANWCNKHRGTRKNAEGKTEYYKISKEEANAPATFPPVPVAPKREVPNLPTPGKPEPQVIPGPPAKATESEADKLARWKAMLDPVADFANELLREMGKLLPNETISNLTWYPKTRNEARNVMDEIKARMDTKATDDVYHPNGTHWREFIVPRGTEKGKRFGDLPKNKLWWWCVQWQPKSWIGKNGMTYQPTKEDYELREMLDGVGIKYFPEQMKKKDVTDVTP